MPASLTIGDFSRATHLVGRSDTRDEAAWRTEIGWPIFSTGTT